MGDSFHKRRKHGQVFLELLHFEMKITEEQKTFIKEAFKKMKGKEDLLDLLNYSKALLFGEIAIPFKLKQITYYSNTNINKNRYKQFFVSKKSGGVRIINAPVNGLKVIQKCLKLILYVVYEPNLSKSATGFIPNKSIVDNAKVHVNSVFVYNIDLKDFFPSINQARIWGRLKVPPFNLSGDSKRLEINNMICALCCEKMDVEQQDPSGSLSNVVKNVLPQGAPTSPILTNIICQQLDFYLTAVAKRFGLKYSRYADDITFSSMHNVYKDGDSFLKEVNRIIKEQDFNLQQNKTRLQRKGFRQEVTGLIVSEKVNVSKRYIKQLRLLLYYWEQYGYEKASLFFVPRYLEDKGHVKNENPSMKNVVRGKLDYLKMIKGPEDLSYKKLLRRFNELTEPDSTDEREVSSERHQRQIAGPQINLSRGVMKKTLPHNPLYTVSFLKKFKISDGSGFKELVHDTALSENVLNRIIKAVKQHPNFVYHYRGEKVYSINYLNVGIQKEIIKLIDLFEQIGVPHFRKTGLHPFSNNEQYTDFARAFKRLYRYGSGQEYSKLQSDIIRIARDHKLESADIAFLPDERIFNIRASFFTWQPSILRGIKYIMDGIFDHTNIKGYRPEDLSKKEITIEAIKKLVDGNNCIEISIFDRQSICMIDSNKLQEFISESTAYKVDFRNLCDWIIECDFVEETSKRLNILRASNQESIEDIGQLVGGFKHMLTFYDNR